jgi:ADP-ribose pyrophosphatase
VSEPPPERVLESRHVFEGRVVSVRVDTVELADGQRATRDVVEHDPVVAIVPFVSEEEVLLVRQYRLPVQATLLEVPAGGVDGGESVEEAAQRELGEECGLRAGRLDRLGAFYVSPGFCDELVHVFLARDLEAATGLAPDEDERLEVVRVSLSEALGLVREGEIRDAKSVIGLTWAWAKLRGVTIGLH